MRQMNVFFFFFVVILECLPSVKCVLFFFSFLSRERVVRFSPLPTDLQIIPSYYYMFLWLSRKAKSTPRGESGVLQSQDCASGGSCFHSALPTTLIISFCKSKTYTLCVSPWLLLLRQYSHTATASFVCRYHMVCAKSAWSWSMVYASRRRNSDTFI